MVILPTGETLNYGVKLSPYDELEVQMGSSQVTFEHFKHYPYTVNMSMSENQNKQLTVKDGKEKMVVKFYLGLETMCLSSPVLAE